MNLVFSSLVPQRRKRRGGAAIVLFAICCVALFGFVALAVDYGMLVSDANRLQRTCDAAALAGAIQLKRTLDDNLNMANATNDAIVVAAKNGMTITVANVSFNATYSQITVTATTTRAFFFGRAIGQPNGTITRKATAARTPLSGVTGVVPLAMTTDDYAAYANGTTDFDLNLINNHNTDFASGTVASLDLRPDNSGKSGAVFENDVINGYDGTVYIGAKIDNALNANIGSQGNKLDIAINQRFTDAASAPYADTGSNYSYPNYPAGDRRIMMILVADPNPLSNNNPTLNARMMVPVYVETVQSSGKGEVLRMRILPGLLYNEDDGGLTLGDDSQGFNGGSIVRLIG